MSIPTIAPTQPSLQLKEVSAVPSCLMLKKQPSRQISNPLVLVSLSLSLLSLCSQFLTDQPVCQENSILIHNERERMNTKCTNYAKWYRVIFVLRKREFCPSLNTPLTLHSAGQSFSRKTDR